MQKKTKNHFIWIKKDNIEKWKNILVILTHLKKKKGIVIGKERGAKIISLLKIFLCC